MLAPNGCTTSEDVFVRDDRIFPEVEAGADFQLNCFTPTNTLNGEGSSIGSIFEYNWSTPNGNFVLGEDTTTLSPSVDSGGLYFLVVTNTSNGCISLDSVNIDTSFTNPLIRFAGDTIITCTNPELVIDASSSDSGAIFQFEWFGENGNVLIGDDTYHPSVSQSGNYIFNITNTENGCFSTAIRTITPDVVFPIADAGPSDILNCTNNSLVQLDGGNSSLGIDFLYQWTTLDGNIVGDTTGTDAATDTQGTYHLEVTDSTNGCSAQDSVTIIEDLVEPTITLPRDTLLTCENPSLILETISLTADVEFLWVFPNGDSSLNGAIEVMTMGSYFITVTGANGCTSFGEVVVTSDQDLPNIDIEDPETLTCQNQSIEISAENSDQGPDLDFLWSTDDGQFAQDSQALQVNPIVTAGGIYYLELRNTLTGCVARDTTEVPSNVDNPEINLVDNPEIFTCTNNSVPLSVTSDVENIQYQWRLDSDLVSEAANFEATAPGVYDILAINPANDCSTSSMVVVQADTIAPFADAGMTQELNCAVDRVNLDGSLSATGNGLSYIWNAPTNQSFSDTTIIQVSQPGLYNLLVINTINGCSTSDTVRVTESRDDPIADAGADIIFCTGTDNVNFTLGGGATSQGNNFSYSWSNSSQTILGTDIQLNVSTADTFLLQVLNTDNQCESADTVLVSERIGPVVSVDSVGAIDCVSNEITFICLLYTSPSPRDATLSRMPSSA